MRVILFHDRSWGWLGDTLGGRFLVGLALLGASGAGAMFPAAVVANWRLGCLTWALNGFFQVRQHELIIG